MPLLSLSVIIREILQRKQNFNERQDVYIKQLGDLRRYQNASQMLTMTSCTWKTREKI
jgi:hypothetical protein